MEKGEGATERPVSGCKVKGCHSLDLRSASYIAPDRFQTASGYKLLVRSQNLMSKLVRPLFVHEVGHGSQNPQVAGQARRLDQL